jgi:hypothetical protein
MARCHRNVLVGCVPGWQRKGRNHWQQGKKQRPKARRAWTTAGMTAAVPGWHPKAQGMEADQWQERLKYKQPHRSSSASITGNRALPVAEDGAQRRPAATAQASSAGQEQAGSVRLDAGGRKTAKHSQSMFQFIGPPPAWPGAFRAGAQGRDARDRTV